MFNSRKNTANNDSRPYGLHHDVDYLTMNAIRDEENEHYAITFSLKPRVDGKAFVGNLERQLSALKEGGDAKYYGISLSKNINKVSVNFLPELEPHMELCFYTLLQDTYALERIADRKMLPLNTTAILPTLIRALELSNSNLYTQVIKNTLRSSGNRITLNTISNVFTSRFKHRINSIKRNCDTRLKSILDYLYKNTQQKNGVVTISAPKGLSEIDSEILVYKITGDFVNVNIALSKANATPVQTKTYEPKVSPSVIPTEEPPNVKSISVKVISTISLASLFLNSIGRVVNYKDDTIKQCHVNLPARPTEEPVIIPAELPADMQSIGVNVISTAPIFLNSIGTSVNRNEDKVEPSNTNIYIIPRV